ncbi:MAG: hypothetical protein GY815_03465 [Gammaproteobacteria bacterium]|nr:hypothetical protein [Gammaproteobacteria bacterium]
MKKTLKHTVIFGEYKPFGKKGPAVVGFSQRFCDAGNLYEVEIVNQLNPGDADQHVHPHPEFQQINRAACVQNKREHQRQHETEDNRTPVSI